MSEIMESFDNKAAGGDSPQVALRSKSGNEESRNEKKTEIPISECLYLINLLLNQY